MARPGELSRPESFANTAHARLNHRMHQAHLQAGKPSLREMKRQIAAGGLMSVPVSSSTIHEAFSSARLPAWPLVRALMQVLTREWATPERAAVEMDVARGWWVRAADTHHVSENRDGTVTSFPTPVGSPLRDFVLLTPEEAGVLLGIPEDAVHRLVFDDVLPAMRVGHSSGGRGLRIPEPAARAYLNQRAEQTRSPEPPPLAS
jgi:hypothetical protein